MTAPIRLVCVDLEAPPLFSRSGGSQDRIGFEPDVGRAVASELGRPLEWLFTSWSEMIPTVQRGDADGVLCGQGITDTRRELVDFTTPYAVFDESVLVAADSTAAGPADFAGRRVGALAGSTNMALAETFPHVITVPFDGSNTDVLGEMVAALRAGEVDAIVDDDVALVPIADDTDLKIAFTHPTQNRWGIAVAKNRPDTRATLDAALAATIADGRLSEVWHRWMPNLAFPLA